MSIVRDKTNLWGDEYIAEIERVCGGRDRFLKVVHSYDYPDHKSFNPQRVAWYLEISVTNVIDYACHLGLCQHWHL